MQACCFPSILLGTKKTQTKQHRQGSADTQSKSKHVRVWREQQEEPTWKNPGGMGAPGIPSFGGMFPSTGLGAAAALCGEQNQGKHGQSYDKSTLKMPPLLPHHTESVCLVSPEHLPPWRKHQPLWLTHGGDGHTEPGDDSGVGLFIYPGSNPPRRLIQRIILGRRCFKSFQNASLPPPHHACWLSPVL